MRDFSSSLCSKPESFTVIMAHRVWETLAASAMNNESLNCTEETALSVSRAVKCSHPDQDKAANSSRHNADSALRSVNDTRKQNYRLVWLSATLAFLVVLAATSVMWSSRRKQPHIVFIMADDLGWNDLSYQGCHQIRTPNIDALAWNGIRLNRLYHQPLCSPSRAALMTGRYPIHTGTAVRSIPSGYLAWRRDGTERLLTVARKEDSPLFDSTRAILHAHAIEDRFLQPPTWHATRMRMQHFILLQNEPRGLPLHFRLLPEWLNSLGYTSYMVGKWHLGFFKTEYTPTRRGFSSHVGSWGAFVDYYNHGRDARGTEHGLDFRRGLESRNKRGAYYTHVVSEEAVSIIRSHPKDRPMFLYLAHVAPHFAGEAERLQVPERYLRGYEGIGHVNRTLYAGMVSALDESVGRVFAALHEQGMLGDTVVVFTSDNGAASTSYGMDAASPWPLKGEKQTLWEGGVRVPGLVWTADPLLHGPGSVYDRLFHVTDWLPTLYEMAGAIESKVFDALNRHRTRRSCAAATWQTQSPSKWFHYLTPRCGGATVAANNFAGGSPADLGPDLDGISHLQSLREPKSAVPRDEVLLNIDPIDNHSAIIQDRYKLVVGTTLGGRSDRWIPVSGNVNPEGDAARRAMEACKDSVVTKVLTSHGFKRTQCGENRRTLPDGVVYSKPLDCAPILTQPSTACDSKVAPCLFDIFEDPCEYHNIANKKPEVARRLLSRLEYYEQTAVPPGNQEPDVRANPSLHNNMWAAWRDHDSIVPQ